MESNVLDRYRVKTPQQRFMYQLIHEYKLAPKVAEQILLDATMSLQGNPTGIRPGQIRVLLAHRDARHGRLLSEIPLVEVTWTIDDGAEDEMIRERFGRVALRRVRIQRLLCEALEQYALASQEDVARALQLSLRTIKRDFKLLAAQGKLLPSRGHYWGIGRGQTHKAQIIERWLKGRSYDQIELDTHHTTRSINRYIQSFVRVVECHRLGFSNAQIAHLLQIGEPLVEEYLLLYEHNDQLAQRQRLQEQLQRILHTPGELKKKEQ